MNCMMIAIFVKVQAKLMPNLSHNNNYNKNN